jgi:hypothetical protein
MRNDFVNGLLGRGEKPEIGTVRGGSEPKHSLASALFCANAAAQDHCQSNRRQLTNH